MKTRAVGGAGCAALARAVARPDAWRSPRRTKGQPPKPRPQPRRAARAASPRPFPIRGSPPSSPAAGFSRTASASRPATVASAAATRRSGSRSAPAPPPRPTRSATPAQPSALPVTAITPTVYNLGVSVGWKRFALSGDVDHVRGGTDSGRPRGGPGRRQLFAQPLHRPRRGWRRPRRSRHAAPARRG